MESAPNSCGACGRPRWPDEKFCAGCGEELAGGSGVTSLGLLSLDDEAETPEPKDRRALIRRLLAGTAAALVLVLTGAILLSGGGNADADNAGDQTADETATDATPAATSLPVPTPLEMTPTPLPRPGLQATVTAILGRDAISEAQNRDEDGAPIPIPNLPTTGGPSYGAWDRLEEPGFSTLTRVQLGDGWLVMFTSAEQPVLVNLENGDIRLLEDIRRPNERAASIPMKGGLLSVPWPGLLRNFSDFWMWQPWSGDEPTVHSIAEGSYLVGILEDPEHGPILLFAEFGWSFVSTDSLALKFETGETRPFELDSVLSRDLTPFGAANVDAFQNGHTPSRYMVGANGRVWSWGWDTGWTDDGPGEVVRDLSGARRILQCVNPVSCTHFIPAASGEWLEIAEHDGGAVQVFSPNRERVVEVEFSESGPPQPVDVLRVVDLRSGEANEVLFGANLYNAPRWLSNSALLIENPTRAVVNVDTGVITELPHVTELRYGTFWLDTVDLGTLAE